MNEAGLLIVTIIALLVIDIPFVYNIAKVYKEKWPYELGNRKRIGIGMAGAYTAMAIAIVLVSMKMANPVLTSFIIGVSIYATYGFTIYGIHPEWPMWMTILETLWGGILLAGTTKLITMI